MATAAVRLLALASALLSLSVTASPRIVSAGAGVTDLLVELGATEQIVGIDVTTCRMSAIIASSPSKVCCL
jgi:iron complex transport system substrate-binding protein